METVLKVKIPHGLEESMDILLKEGIYFDKNEIIVDAIRKLMDKKLGEQIHPHDYYWKKLKSEKSIEISEDELDRLIHEIRDERNS